MDYEQKAIELFEVRSVHTISRDHAVDYIVQALRDAAQDEREKTRELIEFVHNYCECHTSHLNKRLGVLLERYETRKV